MRTLSLPLVLLVLLPLCGCTSEAADTEGEVLVAVRSALELLQAGFDREDETLASQSSGSRFVLGGNVGIRYSDAAFTGSGPAALRSFFGSAFDTLANVEQTLELEGLTISGDVAIVEVETSFTALRLDRTPAENIVFSGVDYMLFEREAGGWRLMRWDEEAPDTEPPAEPQA